MKRSCNNCSEEYEAELRYLNRGQGLFCSRLCASAYNGKRKIVKHDPNVKCAYCGLDFWKKPSSIVKSKSGLFFCSREHQTLGFKSKDISVTSGPTPSSQSNHCLDCGKRIRSSNTKLIRCQRCETKYCIQKWLNGDNSASWTGSCKEPKSFVKKHLIKTRGDKCEECGFDKKSPDGRSIIQMDHIDGDYLNNNLDNLKLLCPNCHAMTPTYGSLNKKSGRRYRKQYYLSKY